MKTRSVIVVVLLNVGLLAAGYHMLTNRLSQKAAEDKASVENELAAWKEKAAQVQRVPSPPQVIYRTNNLRWDQLESADYRQYIANLRAVGCPEMTIRDLIMTDVMRLYAQQRGKFSQNGKPFKFWETDDKRTLKQAQVEERDRQLAQINKDLPAVLRDLLGVNYQRELDKYFVDTGEDAQRLAFLSEDKRSRMLALRDDFEGRREAIAYHLTNGVYSAEDLQALKKIDEEQEKAMAGVLSPDELEQYELSMSPTADHLRKELVGFNPSEAEFRAMFARQKAIDSSYAYADLADPGVRAAKAAEEDAMMSDVKNQWGPDRAAALERSKNPDYQNLAVLTERYDLPPETSQTIADMRQAAEDEKQQLMANKDIPVERLQEALKAIQAETEKAARQTLGEQAFSQYFPDAAWMRNLGGN